MSEKIDLELIKRMGMAQALSEKISSLLWDVKKNCENAGKEYYKDLSKEMAKAEDTIAIIKAVHKEFLKYKANK